MILIERGETADVIVTATEKVVLSPTVFTLKFVNDITKGVVQYDAIVDISPAPQRYNCFHLDLSAFAGHDNGFWTYQVFDQENNVLETGKMKLEGTIIGPKQYENTPTQYKTYGE